jgi:hypothetical protein
MKIHTDEFERAHIARVIGELGDVADDNGFIDCHL